MGQRGPISQPDNVRVLRGTNDRKTPSRPKAVVAVPAKPSWLRREAEAEWKRVTPELERLGLLAKIDRAILSMYCDAWAKWLAVAKAIEKEEPVTPDPTHPSSFGARKHPLWQVYRDSASLVASLAKDLGLTPAARGRMTVPEKEEDDGGSILD